MNDIVIFDQADQPIEVRLESDSVWLSQAQMVELFEKTKQNKTLACIFVTFLKKESWAKIQ